MGEPVDTVWASPGLRWSHQYTRSKPMDFQARNLARLEFEVFNDSMQHRTYVDPSRIRHIAGPRLPIRPLMGLVSSVRVWTAAQAVNWLTLGQMHRRTGL